MVQRSAMAVANEQEPRTAEDTFDSGRSHGPGRPPRLPSAMGRSDGHTSRNRLQTGCRAAGRVTGPCYPHPKFGWPHGGSLVRTGRRLERWATTVVGTEDETEAAL